MLKIAIRYFSKGGHTKTLAEHISKIVNVKAYTIDEPIEEDYDILFLGSSVYLFGIDKKMIKFIEEINKKIGVVVNFSTSAFKERNGGIFSMNSTMKHKFGGGTFKQVSDLVEKCGYKMEPEQFHCYGQLGTLNKGRPNEEDLNNLDIFVKNIINKYDK